MAFIVHNLLQFPQTDFLLVPHSNSSVSIVHARNLESLLRVFGDQVIFLV